MTRIKLNWKKTKPTGPVYLEEAAELLGISREAMRARVHRLMTDEAQDTMPKPKQEETGHRRWYFDRAEFVAFVKTKQQLDKIVRSSRK